MTKERAGKNDWTLADAAVDTQWMINSWESMEDEQKRRAMYDLIDRLLEGIAHDYVLEDAEKRIADLKMEAAA